MEPWRRLDEAYPDAARTLLARCCGATRWVERMLVRRPFGNREGMHAAAREEWWALTPDDWREAFTHHPKIGDRDALRTRFAAIRALSEQEQSGVVEASDAVLDRLAAGNREYEERFGYIFIVCATGKSAGEMLRLLEERLGNDAAVEIRIAAEEQSRITAIRLDAIP
jgi:2-oxo-4-hydroxy-4-carboxy-5-ureidoimidazoline decarboxylase